MEGTNNGRKTVVVTGGASGIGRAICKRFADEGFAVAVLDIREEPREGGKPTHEKIQEDGGDAIFIETDVTDYESVVSALEKVDATYDRLNCVVNNAGVLRSGLIQDTDHEDWEETIDVNLTGVFNGVKAAVTVSGEADNIVIINISSGLGKHGAGGYTAYCASKFGVIGLTEAAADDLSEANIQVNAVCPGMTKTAMTNFSGVPPERVASTVYDTYTKDITGQAIDVR